MLGQSLRSLSVAAVKAAISWPKFSATSYTMVSDLVRQGIAPRTVLDVGANVGQFAIASAKLFPQTIVHSFEPNPHSARQLQKNVAALGNVKVYEVALGELEGGTVFHLNSHSHSSSILPLNENHRNAFPEACEVGTIQVEVSKLDTIAADLQLTPPVLLKLDVQGYEAQVLRGGIETLKRVDYVVLEASFKAMYQDEMLFMELVQIMEGFGFSFLRPVGFLTDSRGEFIQMDALFQRRHET